MKLREELRGRACMLVGLVMTASCGAGQGLIFVANSQGGTIGEYTTTGATVNSTLISGLSAPEGIAVDGTGFLYVACGDGTIGKFTVSGSVINRKLISGLSDPWAIALDGNGHLFVANYGGSIGEYTTSGEIVNAALISRLASPVGIALDGKEHLFVSNYGTSQSGWIGSIGEYSTSGEALNANLITGTQWNWGLLVADGAGRLFVVFNTPPGRIAEYTMSGAAVNAFNTGLYAPTAMAWNENGHLLVADDWLGQIGEYTTSGETVNSALVAGLRGPRGLAVAVPANSAGLAQSDRTVEEGSTVRYAVRCMGTPPLTYQWYLSGTNAVGNPTANPILELASVQRGQSGAYTVVVTNAFGAVTTAPAMLSVITPVEKRSIPALAVVSQMGASIHLDFATELKPSPNWTTFASVIMTNTSQFYFDLAAPLPSQRFYRAWPSSGVRVPPVLSLGFVPAVTLTGTTGDSQRLDYINAVGPTDAWVTVATVTLTNTSQLYCDASAILQPPRLYRVVRVP